MYVEIDPETAALNAVDLVGALRREKPRIFVGSDDLLDGGVTINPMCLSDDGAEYVVERIREYLA